MRKASRKQSEAVRTRLFERYLPVVRNLARRMARKLPSHVQLDDLVSAGMVGLTEAVGRFDPARPDGFDAYVRSRVVGSIRDELRSLDPLTRDQRQATVRVSQAERALAQKLGRAPSSDEVARELGLGLEELHRIRDTQAASISQAVSDAEDEELHECAADPHFTPQDEACDRREALERVARAVGELPERLQTVLALYYQEGLLLKEIGLVLGFSEARACQLLKEAVDRARSVALAA